MRAAALGATRSTPDVSHLDVVTARLLRLPPSRIDLNAPRPKHRYQLLPTVHDEAASTTAHPFLSLALVAAAASAARRASQLFSFLREMRERGDRVRVSENE